MRSVGIIAQGINLVVFSSELSQAVHVIVLVVFQTERILSVPPASLTLGRCLNWLQSVRR
jgi:hypothetical protein